MIIFLEKERAQCEEFVKTYGPVLAELISEMADPDTICRYLGLCQATLPKETSTTKPTPVTYPNHDYVPISPEEAPITCTICQFMISRMKHFVTLNQTEEEILVSLKKSCDLFSVIDYKQKCEDFLDHYGPYIIQMISSDVQPKVACQSLGICEKDSQITLPSTRRQSTASAPVTPAMRYGKCIFGMSYWCTSRQNAELCNVNKLIYVIINIYSIF
jgi:saposin